MDGVACREPAQPAAEVCLNVHSVTMFELCHVHYELCESHALFPFQVDAPLVYAMHM